MKRCISLFTAAAVAFTAFHACGDPFAEIDDMTGTEKPVDPENPDNPENPDTPQNPDPNKPVQNRDMWQKLQRLSWHVGFSFIHIRGHNKDKNPEHAFWNDICDRACTHMINKMPHAGFLVILRYYFKTKKFEPIEIQLVERKIINDV